MRSRALLSLIAAGLFVAAPSALSAQTLYAGAGLGIPTGEFGDFADSGFLGVAGLVFPVGESQLSVGAEGFYGKNDHGDLNQKTNPYGVMGILEYGLAGGGDELGVYIFGGAGILVHKFTDEDTPANDASDTNFGYQGGLGVGVPLGETLGLFVEGRFIGASGTNLFGLLGGFSVDFGG